MTPGQDRTRPAATLPPASPTSPAGRSLRLPLAGLDDLRTIREFVSRTARELGADEPTSSDLVQAVDESATNVLLHGYRGAPGPLDIALERRHGSLAVVVRDRAPAFDPTAWPEPDLMRPLGERAPGGLGIHLARASVDRIEHEAVEPVGNQLTLVRRFDGGSAEAR
jgi:anti-sigma regulatory factor (Ser/Thr protein kinase)